MSDQRRRVTLVSCHSRHSPLVRSHLGESGHVVGHGDGYLFVLFDKGETLAIKKKWIKEVNE